LQTRDTISVNTNARILRRNKQKINSVVVVVDVFRLPCNTFIGSSAKQTSHYKTSSQQQQHHHHNNNNNNNNNNNIIIIIITTTTTTTTRIYLNPNIER
jgi:predicted metalloprotease